LSANSFSPKVISMPTNTPMQKMADAAELQTAKVARNVLNAPAVAEFLEQISAESFRHLPEERRVALTLWMGTAARKWIVREGSARLARRGDVAGLGNPQWAVDALANGQELWMAETGPKQKAQLNHIADWAMAAAPERQLNKLSFQEAIRKTVEWDAARDRQAEKAGPDEPDHPEGVREMGAAPASGLPGARWVRVLSPEALDREGRMMRHCVGSFASRVAEGDCQIYSLRDARNKPLATVEVREADAERLRDLAEQQGWTKERLAAALAMPEVREIVQARGASNAALSAAASAAVADLDTAIRAKKEAPLVAMAEVGEGGLVPHPTQVGFVRWSDIEPGSKMAGRCVWAPSMGKMPEGLEFDILDLRQVAADTALPVNLSAKNLVVNPSVKVLDARAWNIEKVWLERSGPFVKRVDAQLRFGDIDEIALEAPALDHDKYLAEELVDPDAAVPFARLEARARRALTPGLRAKNVIFSNAEHINLAQGWIENAELSGRENASTFVQLRGLRAESLRLDAPDLAFLDAAQVEIITTEVNKVGVETEVGVPSHWSLPAGAQELAATAAEARRAPMEDASWTERKIIESRAQAARNAIEQDRVFTPAIEQSVARWRPDTGRAFECELDNIDADLRPIDLASDETNAVYLRDGLAKDAFDRMRKTDAGSLTHLFSKIAGRSQMTAAAEITPENARGEALPLVDYFAGQIVSVPALIDRVFSENALAFASAAREGVLSMKTRAPHAAGGACMQAPATAFRWAPAKTLCAAGGTTSDFDQFSKNAMSELSDEALKKSIKKARAKKTNGENNTASDLAADPTAIAEPNANPPKNDLDRLLPFSEQGGLIEKKDSTEETSQDFRAFRSASAAQWALRLTAMFKKWDRNAPIAQLVPEGLEIIRALAPRAIEGDVSAGFIAEAERNMGQHYVQRVANVVAGNPAAKGEQALLFGKNFMAQELVSNLDGVEPALQAIAKAEANSSPVTKASGDLPGEITKWVQKLKAGSSAVLNKDAEDAAVSKNLTGLSLSAPSGLNAEDKMSWGIQALAENFTLSTKRRVAREAICESLVERVAQSGANINDIFTIDLAHALLLALSKNERGFFRQIQESVAMAVMDKKKDLADFGFKNLDSGFRLKIDAIEHFSKHWNAPVIEKAMNDKMNDRLRSAFINELTTAHSVAISVSKKPTP